MCPLEYRGSATPGGWVTPKICIFRGFGAAVNHHSVAASIYLFAKNAHSNHNGDKDMQQDSKARACTNSLPINISSKFPIFQQDCDSVLFH